jgi:hypothetical protein
MGDDIQVYLMSDSSGEQTAIVTTADHYLVVAKVRKRLAMSKRISFPGNSSYQSVQNLLSSRPLTKNLTIRIYKTIILPAVLYGCETWSLTLREEHRLGMSENKVLRRIFGLKRDEMTGGWRKLCD